MICIPVSAATNADMLGQLRAAAAEPADLIELRLDSLAEPPQMDALLAAAPFPVIATCRSRREGGGYEGSDAARLDVLRQAAEGGAAHIDAEARDVPHLRERNGAVLIASFHDFEKTPDNLVDIVQGLADLPADWVKIAVTAKRPADNLRVLNAIADCPKPMIAIAMGEMGLMSRILGPAFGSMLTFGSLHTGLESAPGQPTARELSTLYRVNRLTRKTAVYGLLGNPVSQSPGYRVHTQAYAKLGLDAVYIPFLAHHAEDFLATVPLGINLRGLSVTIPHKHSALAWAEDKSETSTRIGAANTLTLRDGRWRADNTDCLAVFESLKSCSVDRGMELAGTRALVLGSGGTARAVGVALFLLGCRVGVAARDMVKAGKLALEMGWEAVSWEQAWQGDWKVVANTTPVGMVPNVDATPFSADGWREGMVAFDAVHNPAETRFLREASAAGATAVSGEDMFIRQAAGQFKLWTGHELPDARPACRI